MAYFLGPQEPKSTYRTKCTRELSAGVMSVLENNPAIEAVHDVKATIMSADSFRFKAEIDFDGKAIAKAGWTTKHQRNF